MSREPRTGYRVLRYPATHNGKPSAACPSARSRRHALDTAAAVRAKMEERQSTFHRHRVVYPYDTTPFVRVAISEVVRTLLEAIVLGVPHMYLFSATGAPP